MAYRQSLDNCLAAAIGEHGLGNDAWQRNLERAGEAMRTLKRWHGEESLPLLHLPWRRDDLAQCREAAARLTEGASDIVHFGTGGSSLGAQMLTQLAGYRVPASRPRLGLDQRPRLHFFDNLDGHSLAEALGALDLKTSRFLAVSKSGGTPETLVQLLAALAALDAAGLDAAHHVVVLTEPGAPEHNAVRRLAQRYRLMALDHDPGVGGRYSLLTNVGMLPALLAGLDPVAVREGAAAVMQDLIDGDDARAVAPAAGAAMVHGLSQQGLTATILMPYSDRLRLFSAWYQQLWAESLGKEGKGTQPVAAAGPVDQHSQMQLFLGGPPDKLLTVIRAKTVGEGPRIPASWRDDPLIGYLAGRAVGDLVDCEARANAATYAGHGRPVRLIDIETPDEATVGALAMHFMLETILTGLMMGIDPFDQPAVEAAKVLTRDYLKAM